jgi:hypothetical protein
MSQALKLPEGVTVSSTALVCSRELPLHEWKSLGCTLSKLDCSIKWWLGDWWHYGLHRYGERKAMATVEDTFARENDSPMYGRAFGTLMNYGSVAGSVATSRRREVLSFSHHVLVAPLEPDEQEYFLNIAVEGDGNKPLSVRGLERKMYETGEMIYLHKMNALDGDFINDEPTRDYLQRLVNAAQISPWLDFVPPWERSDLEDYLERNLFRQRRLVEACEEVETFWRKTGEFARQIECEKASRVDIRQLTKDERMQHSLYQLWRAAEVRKCCMVPPWESTEFEDYLERHCHNPSLASLAKDFEEAANFYSKTAEFVRRVDSKVKARDAATQSDKLHKLRMKTNEQAAMLELEVVG